MNALSPMQVAEKIEAVAEAILRSVMHDGPQETIPSVKTIHSLLSKLKFLLFPACYREHEVGPTGLKFSLSQTMSEVYEDLHQEIKGVLSDTSSGNKSAEAITLNLLEALPDIRQTLEHDVEAIMSHDPAAESRIEIILAYPGFEALLVHRLAHLLHQNGVPLIPRIMSELVHRETGIDIHPAATIAAYCSIDHGTGLIIGATTVIGKHVCLYHNVTLGARSVSRDMRNKKRHPTIGDRVIIYPGATILGDVHVGDNSVVGGNVFLLKDVPANTRIYAKPPEVDIRTGPEAEAIVFK